MGVLGALAGCSSDSSAQTSASASSTAVKDSHSFYGEHQSGISTEVQDRMYFAALNLKTTDRDEIQSLFKEWSAAAAKLQVGELVGEDRSYEAPPKDTGEAMDLSAANLTSPLGWVVASSLMMRVRIALALRASSRRRWSASLI